MSLGHLRATSPLFSLGLTTQTDQRPIGNTAVSGAPGGGWSLLSPVAHHARGQHRVVVDQRTARTTAPPTRRERASSRRPG
ncbi:hypothetical protein [Actinokineospora globicatena]|uniref:hypothetical protein n=1 Tax=Actinokineospora globicatena TaxID=103729 RepID=UPI0020A2E601|nr:hypothetical protein [Actinokineospora globicatena]